MVEIGTRDIVEILREAMGAGEKILAKRTELKRRRAVDRKEYSVEAYAGDSWNR